MASDEGAGERREDRSVTHPFDLDEGRSIGRFMGADMREIGDWRNGEVVLEAIADLGPHLRGPDGRVRPGVMLTLFDNVAGFCGGLSALPDGWVVTTNIAVRAADTLDAVGPLAITSRLLRRGRSAVVTDGIARDLGRDGVVVADCVLTSAILVPDGGPPQWERPAHLALAHDATNLPEYYEWLAIEPVAPDTVSLQLRDPLRNPWGILHGALHTLLAEDATRSLVDGRITSAMLRFMAPVRVGPARATATVLAGSTSGVTVRVEVRDAGAGDRLGSLAILTVDPS